MTARVNLLPETSRQGARQAVARGVAGGLLIALLLALGGVYWWKSSQVSDAEQLLADEQAATALLQQEEAELAEFADLEGRIAVASDLLTTAMAHEVSAAGLLQDLALVTPSDTQFDSLTLTLDPAPEEQEEEAVTTVGGFTLTGRSIASHAPGVERLLLELEKAATITDTFANNSELAAEDDLPEDFDEPVVSFAVDGRFSLTARTDRYTDGLPEVFR